MSPHVAGHAADDWQLAVTVPVNVLMVGPDEVTKSAVAAISPWLSDPGLTIRPDGLAHLPAAERSGALILEDLCDFVMADQRRLADWLQENAGRARIISTSRQPLASMLSAGLFLEALYYRLNVIYIEMTPARTAASRYYH
jgi:hypothetical protein